MAIQPIRLFGDPILVTPASAVVDFDKELRQLVADLTESMQAAPGAGLAAPQIGVSLRVFVWDIDDAIGHLINPTLDLSDELINFEIHKGYFSKQALDRGQIGDKVLNILHTKPIYEDDKYCFCIDIKFKIEKIYFS